MQGTIANKLLDINRHGGVVAKQYVVVDGHEKLSLRIATHAHSDHLVSLNKSVSSGVTIVGTALTLEWIRAMGYRVPERLLKPVEYGNLIKVGDVKVTLEKACHIPGSAQVIIETSSGVRVVYTSDFKKPLVGTPVINADVLVTDATYGNPSYVREFDDCIEVILADLVRELLSKGPVYIYGYYGKIQEVMDVLRREGIDAPFILPHKQYILARIAERHGLNLGTYLHVNSAEAEDVMRDGWYIYLTHVNSRKIIGSNLGNHIILSGWEFRKPYRRIGKNTWLVAFSDHADFRGLIRYIEEAKPKEIIVNRVRSTCGDLFVDYIRRKLGINAFLLP
ncbi:MAG: hypothetical protein DRO14_02400 [Thermoprotei archaeon]|nr:MAG: hypothetical protein DRO14_02400 [Thermoprotei archaeon]